MINKVSADYIEETGSKQFVDPKKLSELEGKINESVKTVMNVSPDASGNVDISNRIKMIVDNKNAIIEPVHSGSKIQQYPAGLSTMTIDKELGYPNKGIIITSRVGGSEGFQLLNSPDTNITYIRSYDSTYNTWQGWAILSDKFGNRKSDEINSESSSTIATSKAVSEVNKKAVEALSKAEEAFLSGIDIKGKVIGAINSRGIGKPIPEDSSWDEVIAKAKEKGSSLEKGTARIFDKWTFTTWTGSEVSRYGVRNAITSKTKIAIAVTDEYAITGMSDYAFVTIYLGNTITPFFNAMIISMRIRGNSSSITAELFRDGNATRDGLLPMNTNFRVTDSQADWVDVFTLE